MKRVKAWDEQVDEREQRERQDRAYERGAPQDHQADAERRAEHRTTGSE